MLSVLRLLSSKVKIMHCLYITIIALALTWLWSLQSIHCTQTGLKWPGEALPLSDAAKGSMSNIAF